MMYVPQSVIMQLERLKETNKGKTNVWELFSQNARVGFELENNFGWLFKKRRL